MSPFLRESKARHSYVCAACDSLIRIGSVYYRGEPYPKGRGQARPRVQQFCFRCVYGEDQPEQDHLMYADGTRQLLLPFEEGERIIVPTLVRYIDVTAELIRILRCDWDQIYQLREEQLEEIVFDRLVAMGYEGRRTGRANRKDGGIDILFWNRTGIPLLGIAQVKHHGAPETSTGPDIVRDMAGVMSYQRFNSGIVVTNTSFTPDAQWVADQLPLLVRLRDGNDLRRWLFDNFTDEAEYRELPGQIELCPGITIDLPFHRPISQNSE